MWCIKRGEDAAFVCAMEAVLDVYKRPFDPKRPLLCMDETTKQCVLEVREPIGANRSHPARYDGEYKRNGVGHLLLFYAPLENGREVHVADNHAGPEWAEAVRRLVEEHYPEAEKITLVMDNLSTHAGSSLYRAFEPEHARALLEKLELCLHPHPWELAEHGRVRAQRTRSSVPRSAHRRHEHVARASDGREGRAQREHQGGPVALHDRGCADQIEASLPCNIKVKHC